MATTGGGDAAARPERQVPGIYRYRIGDFVITAATDGMNVRPLDPSFIPNAAFEEVERALTEAFLPTERLFVPFNPLFIDTGSERILLDAGFADNGPPTAGQLVDNLAAAGVRREDVTKVVISHFHGDHIAGLRTKAGELVYPNAEILVPQAEWAFWMDEGEMSRAPAHLQDHFKNVRRVFGPIANEVTRFAWDQELVPGIRSVAAPGHTPGHTVFAIESGGASMMWLADVTNHPALFVRNPDWSPVFDIDAAEARATRRRLLDMAASESMLVSAYHYPFPAVGHIAREGGAYRYVPAQWMPVL